MKRIGFIVLAFGAAALLAAGLAPAQGPSPAAQTAGKPIGTMRMLVFQGVREGTLEPFTAVTASYLNYTVSVQLPEAADQAAQAAKIKQVFNLKDVNLLTEAELSWDVGQTKAAFHFFQLDKTFYLVMVTPIAFGPKRFRIEVFEQNGGAKTSLLDTEFTLPEKNTAVFGFADKDGKPYFLSMQTTSWPAPDVVVEGEASGDVIRAIGNVRPPRLIKEVAPIYPPAARQAGDEGVVILEAQTDIYGRVQKVKILRSIPLLNQAAIDAVRQWVYEPMTINGSPKGIIFTVTVRFDLGKPTAAADVLPSSKEGFHPYSFRIPYPKEAIEKKLQGKVVVEAAVDAKGIVTAVRVTKSVSPTLDKAAI
ncbi:MAG: TonB family protein, partial [Acidobacteriota bacterium]|nr:TonB family protein [Acidobacteriota bacterium]